ncbi:MAG: hypothetical protein ACO2ON_04155 [Candidatus Nanopusillus sp.]
MVGVSNTKYNNTNLLIEIQAKLYYDKLRDFGYSEEQIASAIQRLSSEDHDRYPYLLGALVYFIQANLYQKMDVPTIKKTLKDLTNSLFSSIRDSLDYILHKALDWKSYFLIGRGILDEKFYYPEFRSLHGSVYKVPLPSEALELFLKYLSKKYSNIKEPSEKAIIKSIKDYLRKKIEELKKYEEENLPKLLEEGVKRIIEIYRILKPIIENYSTYIKNIEIHAKKSLKDLENKYKEGHLSHDYYYFELHMINRKLHYAAKMRDYIEGILKMSYLIGINKVSIDKIMNSLNKGDPPSSLKETYNLLLSEQKKLFDCEIMKKDWDWCTKR